MQYPLASVGAVHLYVFTLSVPIEDSRVAVNSAPASGDFSELVVSPIYLCISIELYIGVSGASLYPSPDLYGSVSFLVISTGILALLILNPSEGFVST